LDEITLAYAAGIIDGEGCVHIRRCKKHNSFWPHIYDLHIFVSSSDQLLTHWLHEQFGGHTCKCKPPPCGHYPKYQWCIQANQANQFLQNILPYLLLKKEQAELAIKFQTEKKLRRKYQSGHPRPWVIYRHEDNMWMALRQLKRIKLFAPATS